VIVEKKIEPNLGKLWPFFYKSLLFVLKSFFSCSELQKFAQNITTKRPLPKGESTIVGIGSHVTFKHDSK
jgi:hypothetical protein